MNRRFNVTTHFLDRHLEEGRGARTALITPDRTWSYAELAQLTNRVGHVLRDELGVRPEERVLLVLADGAEFVASWYAVLKIGAVTAEAYTFLTAEDYAHYLDYTRAGVVVTDTATVGRIREAAASSPWLRRILVVGEDFEALVAAAPDELDPAPTGPDDIAIWKFTTGSTGAPKACVHRMETPLRSFEAYAAGVLGMREDDVVLPVPKLFFGYARDMAALFPFGVGAAGIAFPERSTPERLFELIATHRPTILVNVPTMMAAMVSQPEHDLSALRLCTSAGEALPAELYRRWMDAFGVEVLDGVGSSEAYHVYISAGREVPGYRARVMSEDGKELPDGETGRLWIDGPTTALMYWAARERSVQTFAGDTVMSADLFVREADGSLHYRGRADDLLKVGGIWVAPAEIENCLLGHPHVVECAVVGVEREGLTLARAHVVAGGALTTEELIAWVRERLSGHKAPREIRFEDELPRTANGKLDRRALKALA